MGFGRQLENYGAAITGVAGASLAWWLIPLDHAWLRAETFANGLLTVASIFAGFQTLAMSLLLTLKRTLARLRETGHLDRFVLFVVLSTLSSIVCVVVALALLASIPLLPTDLTTTKNFVQEHWSYHAGVGATVGISLWCVGQTLVMLNVWRAAVKVEVAPENTQTPQHNSKRIGELPEDKQLGASQKNESPVQPPA